MSYPEWAQPGKKLYEDENVPQPSTGALNYTVRDYKTDLS